MRIAFIVNSLYLPPDVFKKKIQKKLIIPTIHESQFLFTERKGHAEELTKQAIGDQSELIVACGGDGTLHEVVNGYLGSSNNSANTSLALLPAGSGNDFARNFNFSKDPVDFSNRISSLTFRDIDVGQIFQPDGKSSFFHNEISFGIGAEVIKRLQTNTSKGKSYLTAALKTFNSFKPQQIKLIGDDFVWGGKALLVVVANGRFMGGGLSLAPEAITHDGIFNITVVGEVSLTNFLTRIPSILKSKPLKHRNIFYFESTSLEVQSQDNVLAEADGELISPTPSRVLCLPSEISFLA